MRHHPKYVPVCIADTRNIAQGSIRIRPLGHMPVLITIIEDYLAIVLQLVQQFFISIIPSFPMGYRYLENLISVIGDVNVPANKLLVTVAQKRTWQKM